MCDKNNVLRSASDQEVLLKEGRESPGLQTTLTCDMSTAMTQQELYNKLVAVYIESQDPLIIDNAIKTMNEYFDTEINKSFQIITHHMDSYDRDFLLSNSKDFPLLLKAVKEYPKYKKLRNDWTEELKRIKEKIAKREEKEFERTVKLNELLLNQGSVLHNKPLNDTEVQRSVIEKCKKAIARIDKLLGNRVSESGGKNIVRKSSDNQRLKMNREQNLKEESVLQNEPQYKPGIQRNETKGIKEYLSKVHVQKEVSILQNQPIIQSFPRIDNIIPKSVKCSNECEQILARVKEFIERPLFGSIDKTVFNERFDDSLQNLKINYEENFKEGSVLQNKPLNASDNSQNTAEKPIDNWNSYCIEKVPVLHDEPLYDNDLRTERRAQHSETYSSSLPEHIPIHETERIGVESLVPTLNVQNNRRNKVFEWEVELKSYSESRYLCHLSEETLIKTVNQIKVSFRDNLLEQNNSISFESRKLGSVMPKLISFRGRAMKNKRLNKVEQTLYYSFDIISVFGINSSFKSSKCSKRRSENKKKKKCKMNVNLLLFNSFYFEYLTSFTEIFKFSVLYFI